MTGCSMFEGFSDKRVATSRGQIALYQGGSGPPVLLLHGFPETRVAWHRVAPSLACRFTIVAADLPGYGDSAGPAATDDHAAPSKRAFAMTLFEAMRQLGFERFAVIGHDRGARVAYRLAIDAPGSVAALGVLDVVPSLDMATALTHDLAVEMANWFFLSQRSATAERLITCAGADYLDAILAAWAGRGDAITPEARREYARCFVRPEAGAVVGVRPDRALLRAAHRVAPLGRVRSRLGTRVRSFSDGRGARGGDRSPVRVPRLVPQDPLRPAASVSGLLFP